MYKGKADYERMRDSILWVESQFIKVKNYLIKQYKRMVLFKK